MGDINNYHRDKDHLTEIRVKKQELTPKEKRFKNLVINHFDILI